MMLIGEEIQAGNIVAIYPENLSVLLRSKKILHQESAIFRMGDLIVVKCKDEIEFNEIKFEFISHIKKRPNPEDRVADFECRNDDGSFDFKKMDRLVEMRKTREEKQREMDDELYLYEQFKKHKIPYNGPLNL